MIELPLFPLHTVLFPGMPLTLHVFEERYKLMIRHCLEQTLTFGVVLIEHGVEALGPLPVPYRIGCTAHILQVETLSQGRLNISALGRSRFLIETLDAETQPYLIGQVSLIPLLGEDTAALRRADRQLRGWVERYLQALKRAGQIDAVPLEHLPQDPLTFAYLAATLLQVPPLQKQALLAAPDALQLVTDLNALYRREVTLLAALLEKPGDSRRAENFRLN